MGSIATEFGMLRLALLGLALTSFFGTIYYFLRFFLPVALHRHSLKKKANNDFPVQPVSVIVVVNDHLTYIQEGLNLLLHQDYPLYEVIVVNDRPELEETKNALEQLAEQYPHLYVTTIRKDPVFSHSYKLSLTVGIKAAQYEHILLLDSDSYLKSNKWLHYMAKGFLPEQENVAIGYCGIKRQKGFANRCIRLENLYSSMRMLGRAVKGKPYKSDTANFGFTQNLFYESKGFSEFLRMNTGYNDIFIQKIARRGNTSVVLKKEAVVERPQYGGFAWWFRKRKYDTYMQRHYPFGVKAYLGMDAVFRFVFWGSTIALAALSASFPDLIYIAGLLAGLRWILILTVFNKVAYRLGETGLLFTFVLFDIFSPLTEAWLSISRKFNPCKDLWI